MILEGEHKDGEIKAEVALLTHNIKIMGVDNSETEEYGAKLIIRGDEDETSAYIHNVEMTKCGQPQIAKFSSCITTLVNDYVDDISFNKMSFHHTYGRGFLLAKETFGIEVSQNVLYEVAGNNIYVTGMFSSAFLI